MPANLNVVRQATLQERIVAAWRFVAPDEFHNDFGNLGERR